jgi:hypothetical protein
MKVRIGVQLGMTIQVMGVDYVKPSAWAEVDFEDIPSEEELKKKWSWLWEQQIGPQAEEMLDMMTQKLTKTVGPYREKDVQRSTSTSPVVENYD